MSSMFPGASWVFLFLRLPLILAGSHVEDRGEHYSCELYY